MTNWNELKPFRQTLIAAFDVAGLEEIVRYHCHGRELEQLAGRNLPKPKIVDDMIDHTFRLHGMSKQGMGAGAS